MVGAAVLSLPVARLAARSGRRPALLVAYGTATVGASCALVAGSALLTESMPVAVRPDVQGLSDLAMNTGGALGGVLAGVAVAVTSYAALAVAVVVLVLPFLAVTVSVSVRTRPA